MFRPEEIKSLLNKKPFVPLRFVASEGLEYEVRHPDLVFVGERHLILGAPSRRGPGIFSSTTHLALVHLVGIEELPTEPSPLNA